MLNAYITSYMKTLIFCGEFKYHRNWHWCLTIESSIKSWNNYCVFTITTQPQNVSLYHSRNWPIILERLYDMLIILYVIFFICIELSDITILYIQIIKSNELLLTFLLRNIKNSMIASRNISLSFIYVLVFICEKLRPFVKTYISRHDRHTDWQPFMNNILKCTGRFNAWLSMWEINIDVKNRIRKDYLCCHIFPEIEKSISYFLLLNEYKSIQRK